MWQVAVKLPSAEATSWVHCAAPRYAVGYGMELQNTAYINCSKISTNKIHLTQTE